MKSLAAFLALVTLILVPSLHADTVDLTLNGVTVVGTPIANGYNFTYANETLGVLADGNLLNSSTSVFTATYVDALGTLGVFNFTDLCTSVTVIGPPVSCQNLALSFTDATLGDASIAADIGASIGVGVGVGTIDVGGANLVPQSDILGVSIGGGSGEIDFSTPPSNSPVPEPGTLSLMATGLLGAAGAIRRRFVKA